MSNSKNSSTSPWAVVSANTGTVRKNAQSREQARAWKRSQSNPDAYRIVDRRS